mmetsp:Transcript_13398/g.39936  ORF Transcript_13398/g.39936 Transcript_13398/m.39936 type:complete len:211 (-) Transcript_13398:589-1221(-)
MARDVVEVVARVAALVEQEHVEVQPGVVARVARELHAGDDQGARVPLRDHLVAQLDLRAVGEPVHDGLEAAGLPEAEHEPALLPEGGDHEVHGPGDDEDLGVPQQGAADLDHVHLPHRQAVVGLVRIHAEDADQVPRNRLALPAHAQRLEHREVGGAGGGGRQHHAPGVTGTAHHASRRLDHPGGQAEEGEPERGARALHVDHLAQGQPQ